MNNSYLQNIKCGSSLPINNPHAISVSLPNLIDVINYEENNPELLNKLESGYPRFVPNRFVKMVVNIIADETKTVENTHIFLFNSAVQAQIFTQKFPAIASLNFKGIDYVLANKTKKNFEEISDFIKHTGFILSGRKAEDWLKQHKYIKQLFRETMEQVENPLFSIKSALAFNYQAPNRDLVNLYGTGMTAMYHAITNIQKIRANQNKHVIVQIGWIYSDTTQIIQKYGTDYKVFTNIFNTDEIENWINRNRNSVSMIIIELPTNPLIQVCDLEFISKLARKFEIPLIADTSIAPAPILNALPYVDVVVESLSKFAGGNADLLMGAVLLNAKSSFAVNQLMPLLPADLPYYRDLKRLSHLLHSYSDRITKISENTLEVFEYLKSRSDIETIFWVKDSDSIANFNKIKSDNYLVPGVLSFIPEGEFSRFYNDLPLPKGPSFGTSFTLVMPYVYMAHYNLLKSEMGQQQLDKAGISKNLLRLSVGTEYVGEIIHIFDKLFKKIR